MRRCLLLIVLGATMAGPIPTAAAAPTPAEQALADGIAAYRAELFDKARDLFLKAAGAAKPSPDAFVWLGKAQLQLGRVEQAIAAWEKAHKLMPADPYVVKMLKALRGEVVDADVRIATIRGLLDNRMSSQARGLCERLLAHKTLTDTQRAAAMTLHARSLLDVCKGTGVLPIVIEVRARYPKLADEAELTLLAGQAKLRAGGTTALEGLALLTEVTTKHAKTPQAAVAEYELAVFEFSRTGRAGSTDRLAKWINAHDTHRLATEAIRTLMAELFRRSALLPAAAGDEKIRPIDTEALAWAGKLYARLATDAEASALTKTVLGHLGKTYAGRGAHAGAIAGASLLLKGKLPPASKGAVLQALLDYETSAAIEAVGELLRSGKAGDEMPKALTALVGRCNEINAAGIPQVDAWSRQADLAAKVMALAAGRPKGVRDDAPVAPHDWAVAIALPVVRGGTDAKAVAAAVKLIAAVRDGYLKVKAPAGLKMAAAVSSQLIEASAKRETILRDARWAHVGILDRYARWTFDANIADGLGARNAALGDHQKALIDLLKQIVADDTASQGAKARQTLAAHVKPWLDRGHYATAQAGYALLAAALDEAQRREVELDIAALWVRQSIAAHNRLLAAGLDVPAKIDLPLAKALKRCYELQGDLKEGDPYLARVRALWSAVLTHYADLEYYTVVENAIQIKGAKPAPAAERYANLQLAMHRESTARRDLARVLARHGAKDKITLSPGFVLAIKAYVDFITAHPTSKLVPQAVARITGIARTFETHGAYDVAVKIYTDFAAVAAKQPVLAAAGPGSSSTAETMAFAAAGALDAKARKALAEALDARPDKTVPPPKLSAEFAAAIGAYEAFVRARPDGPLSGASLAKIMAVGSEYARIDAWDVAESVFADLLERKLPLRKPERLEFSRGVCHLGKVMPDHARSVLAAMTKRPAMRLRDLDDLFAGRYLEGVPEPGVLSGAGGGGGGLAHRTGKRPAGSATRKPKPVAGPSAGATKSAPAKPDTPAATEMNEELRREADKEIIQGEMLAMAAIKREQSRRAVAIASLQDRLTYKAAGGKGKANKASQAQGRQQAPPAPVLSEAELARQDKALAAAYAVFQNVRKTYPQTASAKQARGEIMVMVAHWRTIRQWTRAADLAAKYLADNPADIELPAMRLSIARDYLAWAGEPIKEDLGKQALLAEVSKRFAKARAELEQIVKTFAKDRTLVQQAQWDIATSVLAQARVVNAFSSTLARGQFVRAARQLQKISGLYHDHPKITLIPQMLWDIASELAARKYYDEAMIVWNDLTIHYPSHALASQAAVQIARTYENTLGRPLKAVEVYQEICFARGGSDAAIQTAIYTIGVKLKTQKRWVEALHVLGTFVDSFPHHANAGQALTMVGQIHQTNQAWEDAIAAYHRVINEFPKGTWVREARWSIAECRINLSQWSEATKAYRAYQASYAKDARAAETVRRLGVVKDLARYQTLVDEKGQRKADDAQFQIARIVQTQLANPTKAIIEYRKIPERWAKSHLADDALYAAGTAFLSMGETAKAREALLSLAARYPDSTLADDALFQIGQSYEAEAQALAGVTRGKSLEKAKDIAQKKAYAQVQGRRRAQRYDNKLRLEALRRAGKAQAADVLLARDAQYNVAFDQAEVQLAAQEAKQETEVLTAAQLADRQDKINAALRRAVGTYKRASGVPLADKAGDALLRMAVIYHERLKDSPAALATWLEIVRQFTGTSVAEDASWRIAQYHERAGKHADAVAAYKSFIRSYRASTRAVAAQFAIAENYEHLGEWIKAMDAYTNYVKTYPKGPMAQKAKEQITWIKTYRL